MTNTRCVLYAPFQYRVLLRKILEDNKNHE